MILPDWYKNFILANGVTDSFSKTRHIYSMNDRPCEFVYNAMKIRPHLLNIMEDMHLFCLTSPEIFIRKMRDLISEVFKRFKQLSVNEDPDNEDVAVRNLAYGVSAGHQDLKTYEKWIVSN